MCGEKKKKRPPFSRVRQYGTLNATPRIPQQFAKITAVICRRLCSYCVPVLVCPYTYFHAHIHARIQRTVMYTHTHTLVARRWYYCERACSKQFPIRLPRSIHSVPSSLHSPLPSTPEPLPPMSILSPRSKPLNASAGVHVHPNRLYLHLIASSKVLLPHV